MSWHVLCDEVMVMNIKSFKRFIAMLFSFCARRWHHFWHDFNLVTWWLQRKLRFVKTAIMVCAWLVMCSRYVTLQLFCLISVNKDLTSVSYWRSLPALGRPFLSGALVSTLGTTHPNCPAGAFRRPSFLHKGFRVFLPNIPWQTRALYTGIFS